MRLICVVVLRYTLIVGLGHSELFLIFSIGNIWTKPRPVSSNNKQMCCNISPNQIINISSQKIPLGYKNVQNTMRKYKIIEEVQVLISKFGQFLKRSTISK